MVNNPELNLRSASGGGARLWGCAIISSEVDGDEDIQHTYCHTGCSPTLFFLLHIHSWPSYDPICSLHHGHADTPPYYTPDDRKIFHSENILPTRPTQCTV
ncbi:hypothetical protein AWENTII_008681 [Aspergillus wentii]